LWFLQSTLGFVNSIIAVNSLCHSSCVIFTPQITFNARFFPVSLSSACRSTSPKAPWPSTRSVRHNFVICTLRKPNAASEIWWDSTTQSGRIIASTFRWSLSEMCDIATEDGHYCRVSVAGWQMRGKKECDGRERIPLCSAESQPPHSRLTWVARAMLRKQQALDIAGTVSWTADDSYLFVVSACEYVLAYEYLQS
jgi:hypothetical protein